MAPHYVLQANMFTLLTWTVRGSLHSPGPEPYYAVGMFRRQGHYMPDTPEQLPPKITQSGFIVTVISVASN